MNEVWKEIEGYPNYKVSNLGQVLGLKRGKILKPFPDSWNYPMVSLRENGIKKHIRVHKLVAEAFLGKRENFKIQVDHIDRDILNNRIDNLRYCTQNNNKRNSKKYKTSSKKETSSRYKGVSWHKATGKWLAKIRYNKKDFHLGVFTEEKDAAEAYNKAALNMDPTYSYLNFF